MTIAGYGGSTNEPDTGRPPVLSVLYVDDEPFLLNVCKLYLERRPDISVSIASSVENALKLMETMLYDVVISDYQMPGTDGIGFLKILREKNCSVPFIFFTGREREVVMAGAPETSALYYIGKSGNPKLQLTELESAIRKACGQHLPEQPVGEKQLLYPAAF
jgi:CheY-like chemotaxis protein